MTAYKLTLDDFYEDDFVLIAIHTTLEAYRLSYFLNLHLGIQLSYSKKEVSQNIYTYEDSKSTTLWSLMRNKIQVDPGITNSTELFSAKSIQYLVPEHKKTDYFLKIDPKCKDVDNILTKIRSIPQIITTFVIEPQNLKSKNNLIFY